MRSTFHEDAAVVTAAAADRLPARSQYTGAGFVPVRSDHLAELLRVQAEHGRILAAITHHLGISAH